MWRLDVSTCIAAADLNLNNSTISRWYEKIFNIIRWKYEEHFKFRKIGGPGCIVEVDESLLVKKKNWRGRNLRGQNWIVGGVVRGSTNEFFIERVVKRSRPILLDINRRRINPGTIIITDEWRGYKDLQILFPTYNFIHLTVNHSMWYVDPINFTNTQTIEGFWSYFKRTLRKKGTNIGDIDRRIGVFYCEIFKKNFRRNIFLKLIEVFREFTIYNTEY